ncbi:hypothetical protein [Phenylobacterium sp.]|uniref:hypothetical protein n=1 Tax=Phenylobacterium sp. TaxID=1871053 RepID=UPI0019892388|nr:hypothetical protein [Phenylobacterium sp.]MBC7168761.1 hypothetical protein [Phenylobacterium sp.]
MTTPTKTAEAVERLIERLKSSAAAFRAHPIYTADGDPVRLTVQADEMDEAAEALTHAQQSEARVREALEVLIRHFEGDELHDEGAFDPACADCLALDEARKVLASLTAPKPEEGETALHPATRDLVDRFSAALADKLAKAEQKYGYSDGWLDSGWEEECRRQLHHHAAKGDPRDVAAYAAFCWHHGWPTTLPASPAPSRVEPVAWAYWTDPEKGEATDEEGGAVQVAVFSRYWIPQGRETVALYTSPPDAQPRIEALEKELQAAAAQFRFYADSHAAKGTPDGDAKAKTNAEWAERLERTISARVNT